MFNLCVFFFFFSFYKYLIKNGEDYIIIELKYWIFAICYNIFLFCFVFFFNLINYILFFCWERIRIWNKEMAGKLGKFSFYIL